MQLFCFPRIGLKRHETCPQHLLCRLSSSLKDTHDALTAQCRARFHVSLVFVEVNKKPESQPHARFLTSFRFFWIAYDCISSWKSQGIAKETS